MGTSVVSDDLCIDFIISLDSSAAAFVAFRLASDFSGAPNTDDDDDCLADFDAADAINCKLNRRLISGSVDFYFVGPA